MAEAGEIIRGTIENVVYYNEKNDYSVLEISCRDTGLLITAVGNMPIPFAGENVILKGSFGYHKEFGKQFVIDSFEKTLPEDVAGILQYLSARTVKGVGPATAKKIVNRFGKDTFDVIEQHPEWLADIPGITMKKAAAISESFCEQNGQREVIMFCKDYMTVTEAARVYKRLGAGAVGIILENPYILCEGEGGLSFTQADGIARSIGIAADNVNRIRGGINYILEYNASTNGHTCLPKLKLAEAALRVLEVERKTLEDSIDALILCGELSSYTADGETFVMLNDYAEAEDYIARRILSIDNSAPRISGEDIISLVDKVERQTGIVYERLQKKAIYESLAGGVTIITGGPGTGKTTVVKALMSIFSSLGMKVVLAAPTGRAAKRLGEQASAASKTIHRMLEMERGSGEARFGRGMMNPIDEEVCIVDEASMIDVMLMQALVKAIRRGGRLILIGDSNQLPSVGSGNVLADLIAGERIRKVELTEIFRQSKESLIITNAHKINQGEHPNLSSVDADFFFVTRRAEKDIPSTIASLITERLPAKYGGAVKGNIQVISPSKKGFGGVETLNAELQSALNPKVRGKTEKSAHGTLFREGDRVMQTVNNYEIEWVKDGAEGIGIFNGDIGTVEKIDLDEAVMKIRFDDRTALYTFDLLDELELAYAITVHKSQGSEYPIVIIPMYSCPPMLETRNLLYTAVTRAKKMVIMVGRPDIVGKMIDNNREVMRYTTLKSRIADYV